MRHYPGHARDFAGYPVLEWTPDLKTVDNAAGAAFAIRCDWDDYEGDDAAWLKRFTALMSRPYARQIPALIVGMWGNDGAGESGRAIEEIVTAIAANRDNLPNLRGLFVGDIVSEENEISWIHQTDLSPLLNAYPDLEYLTIRGGDGLRLGQVDLPRLKALRIETGGMDSAVVRSVGEANLPELETLMLWLGTRAYGANYLISDFAGFYQCGGMPKLKTLGLCDCDMQDAVAAFIATAPVLERIETLDMSMGTLSDDGALALLSSPYIRALKRLEIHYHFCTPEMVAKLEELRKDGVTVNISDGQDLDNNWRFVAVGE